MIGTTEVSRIPEIILVQVTAYNNQNKGFDISEISAYSLLQDSWSLYIMVEGR